MVLVVCVGPLQRLTSGKVAWSGLADGGWCTARKCYLGSDAKLQLDWFAKSRDLIFAHQTGFRFPSGQVGAAGRLTQIIATAAIC